MLALAVLLAVPPACGAASISISPDVEKVSKGAEGITGKTKKSVKKTGKASKKGKAEVQKADKDTVKLVKFFIKAETSDLPVEAVPHFLQIDPATLPSRLRDKYMAKRLELLALERLAASKRSRGFKRFGKDKLNTCSEPDPMTRQGLKLLLRLGFTDVPAHEVNWLMKETNCTLCELRYEFSMTMVKVPSKKKRRKKRPPPKVHFLFQEDDPVLVLLAHYRSGLKRRQTSFFGIGGGPKCRQ